MPVFDQESIENRRWTVEKNDYAFENNSPSLQPNHNLNQIQLAGASAGLAARGDIKLPQDVRDMALHRGQGDDQRPGNLLVAGPGSQQAQDFQLALRQGRNIIR